MTDIEGQRLPQIQTVRDLAKRYRAAFHGHLAVGRAIAGHVPAIGPLTHKWLLVQAAYTLVTHAAIWRERLNELTVPLNLVGSPAPSVAAFAQRICAMEWQEALDEVYRYVAAWSTELATFPTRGDAYYHDVQIVARAREQFQSLLEIFASQRYPATPVGATLDPAHFENDENVARPTGTLKLPVRRVPHRVYPPNAPTTSDQFWPRPDASDKELYAASLHSSLQIEFISVDIPLLNAAENDAMPIEFYVDMVRHAHDEMRHAKMLEENLHRFGAAIGDFPFTVPDRYELLVEQDLAYRLVIMSRTGESEAIEALTEMIPQLMAAGEIELAAMWGHVLTDEVRHTLFGNKWLRFLVGDDDEAVDRATRDSIARYNEAILAGRLSKPPRPVDYLTTAGPPIDVVLRELAGFSPREIEIMQTARGTRGTEIGH